jgi:electron transfer flavoprotein alpha subunit
MIQIPEFWDIAVFMVAGEGEICAGSKKVLSKARVLADSLGCYLKAITDLREKIQDIIWLGADMVYTYRGRDEDVLFKFVEKEKPEILLFCSCQKAGVLSPFIAHKFQTGICTNVFDAYIDTSDRKIIAKSLRFSGRLVVEQKINGFPQIVVFDDLKLPEPFINKDRTGREVEL